MPSGTTKRSLLNPLEYNEYFGFFIKKVPDLSIEDALRYSMKTLLDVLVPINEENASFRYQPKKWSIKEVVTHLIDVEQVFNYRALKISRIDFSKNSGFDQNTYVQHSEAEQRTLRGLIKEYTSQRTYTIDFFAGMSKRCSPTLSDWTVPVCL